MSQAPGTWTEQGKLNRCLMSLTRRLHQRRATCRPLEAYAAPDRPPCPRAFLKRSSGAIARTHPNAIDGHGEAAGNDGGYRASKPLPAALALLYRAVWMCTPRRSPPSLLTLQLAAPDSVWPATRRPPPLADSGLIKRCLELASFSGSEHKASTQPDRPTSAENAMGGAAPGKPLRLTAVPSSFQFQSRPARRRAPAAILIIREAASAPKSRHA